MSELEDLRNENQRLRNELAQYERAEKEWEESERKLLGKLKRTKAMLDSRTRMLEDANKQIEELKKLVPKHKRRPSGPKIAGAAHMVAQEMGALGGSDDEEDAEDAAPASSSLSLSPYDSNGPGIIDRDPKVESTSKGRIKRSSMVGLESKVEQRSTIEETISRGILYHRPDSRTEHSVVEQSKLLAKRRASAQVGKALESRTSVQDLRTRGIYKETEDLMEDTKRKRRVSRVLEATLNPRARATMEDLTQSGITLASLFSEGTGVESADLDAFGGAGRSGRRARGSGEIIEEGDEEDAKTREVSSSAAGSAAAAGGAGSAGMDDGDEKVVEIFQWTGAKVPEMSQGFTPLRDRVDKLYATRSDVNDLIFKGILKGHPSLRSRMNRIRKNKERRENRLVIDFLYRRRPRDNETMVKRLVDMRILPKESLKAREIHKRRLSRQLEASLISRPTPQEINDDMGYQVIDLGPLLLSFLVGSAMVEAQNAMSGTGAGGIPGGLPAGAMPRALEGPPGSGPGQLGAAVDAYASSRAADLAGGGGVGMAMAASIMNAQQNGRRGSADSDVSDMAANADRELLKNLKQEVADKEAEIRKLARDVEQMRAREKEYIDRLGSMEMKYQESLRGVTERGAEVDDSSRKTVDVAIDELHRTQLDLQQAKIYIEVLRKRMETRGIRMETEDDLKIEIKERLAAFVVERPTIEDLMARNIIPTQQSLEDKQRASTVVSSHLDSMKKGGFKERTYLPTVVDEVSVDDTPAAGSGASQAEIDSLTGIIDDLNAQVKKLKSDNEDMVNELDELRKMRSSGADESDVSLYLDLLRKWILAREWIGSSMKYVERESANILEMKEDKVIFESMKTVIRTYMDEVSELLATNETAKRAMETVISQRDKQIADVKKELAEAQAQMYQAQADKEDALASHTTPGGPDEYGSSGPSGSGGVDETEFASLKAKVARLEAETMRAAEDKMTMMMVMSKEMESLRSQLRQMGRMQQSLVAMGRVQD